MRAEMILIPLILTVLTGIWVFAFEHGKHDRESGSGAFLVRYRASSGLHEVLLAIREAGYEVASIRVRRPLLHDGILLREAEIDVVPESGEDSCVPLLTGLASLESVVSVGLLP